VYPEGSREDQPLTPLSNEEALEFAQNAIVSVDGGKCRSGVCEI